MSTLQFKKNRGYSLVETVLYISILAVVYFLIVNTLLQFNSSYKNIVALRIVDNSALDALERISRDIRSANIIDTGTSVFGTSPGILTLVDTSTGISTTTRFYLDEGIVRVDINGVYYGPLTLSSATVSNLTFTKMDSSHSSAIKIDMTVSGRSGPVTKTKSYHTTLTMKSI